MLPVGEEPSIGEPTHTRSGLIEVIAILKLPDS